VETDHPESVFCDLLAMDRGASVIASRPIALAGNAQVEARLQMRFGAEEAILNV
jgi:hypothetical protein